jgi:hypothetical protein
LSNITQVNQRQSSVSSYHSSPFSTQSYIIEVQIEETITMSFIGFQTVVLHGQTFSSIGHPYLTDFILHVRAGEHRNRVITQVMLTSSNLSEIFASANQIAVATLLANKAWSAPSRISWRMPGILYFRRWWTFSKRISREACASAQLSISDNLKMFPVLVLGLLKNVRMFCKSYTVSAMLTLLCRWVFVKAQRSLQIFECMRKPF